MMMMMTVAGNDDNDDGSKHTHDIPWQVTRQSLPAVLQCDNIVIRQFSWQHAWLRLPFINPGMKGPYTFRKLHAVIPQVLNKI